MTFREQLVITIVDKAVIGLLVAMAGFWLSRMLERFKSDRALANEFAKQRLPQIAQLWEAMYTWESEVTRLAWVLPKQIGLATDDESLKLSMEPLLPEIISLISDRSSEIRTLVDKSRFWLGDTLHKRFMAHQQRIHGQLGMLLNDPRGNDPTVFESDLASSRQSIYDYLKN